MHRPIPGLLLLLGILGLLASCHDRDDHGEQKRIALHAPAGTPKRPQGMTALTVHAGAAEPFTKADVVTYFKSHNLPKNAGALAQFQVDTLEFMTSKDVNQRLQGVSTGLADNDRVGFVTLSGTFVFTGPGSDRKSATFNRAYAVFDAATGNLLMICTLERTDKPQ
jgi:hypothetical protein